MVTTARAREVVHSRLRPVVGTDAATFDVINTLLHPDTVPYLLRLLGAERESIHAEECPNEDIQYESEWAERWVTLWEAVSE